MIDNKRLEELLLTVRKPARYVGGEWNAVKKEWTPERFKFLISFPDVYEVGMSHLGIKILYGILNKRDDCLAERAFAPWPDFEAVLRTNTMPLFSLESRHPLSAFDAVGFSIAYELAATNILTMLDLGGIPLCARERTDADPLVIAGGPVVFNPEPFTDFIDAFVIGDGEEAVGEIVEACRALGWHAAERRASRDGHARRRMLEKLAAVKGVYVPSLYRVSYAPDGAIGSFEPLKADVPARIEKRTVACLDDAYYPCDQIVPNVEAVHDRITVEIMRGCKHMCRFCQATRIYRPWRERSKEKIAEIALQTYGKTGYDEVSLLSLSSGDHSAIREIIDALNDGLCKKGVSISVPSLRIEDIIKELPALISKVKKPGLTFAPEAATERLRRVINKNISPEKLMHAVTESYKAGWRRVKLYFMIGLPTETAGDVEAIIDYVYAIADAKRAIDGRSATVAVSINPFVPKPHTPFQWQAMERMDKLMAKREMLRSRLRGRIIELSIHPFNMSFLEAAVARGDRRMGEVMYRAWQNGARFDGWEEHFNLQRWEDAFRTSKVDPEFYVSRTRSITEILPWDFIDTGMPKEALLKEARSAIDGPVPAN